MSTQPEVVQDQNGNLLTKEAEQRERRTENFCTVLNRPDPEIPTLIQDSNRVIEMKKGHISCNEFEDAIMKT